MESAGDLTRWDSRLGLINNAWARAAWVLCAIFAAAILTHALELSAVVGGFFAGLGVGDGLRREVREHRARTLKPLVLMVMPFFFVMIGVQAQWGLAKDPVWLGFVAALVAVSVAGKVAGGMFGTVGHNSWRERWLIAFGMVPRGEIALVVATLGYEQGHLTHHLFVALVLVAIVLSILGPIMVAPFAKRLAAATIVRGVP